jgi:hypothetical protein
MLNQRSDGLVFDIDLRDFEGSFRVARCRYEFWGELLARTTPVCVEINNDGASFTGFGQGLKLIHGGYLYHAC